MTRDMTRAKRPPEDDVSSLADAPDALPAAVTSGRPRKVRYCGEIRTVEADDSDNLLDVARRSIGIRSAVRGCDNGRCGACRLIVSGTLVNACGVRWGEIEDGATIESYEALEDEPAAIRAVDAFSTERPTRCRMCVGALGVTAVAIDRAGNTGDEDAVDAALETATCMCTGRGSWRRALLLR